MSGSRNPNLGLTIPTSTDFGLEEWRKNLGQSSIHLGLPRKRDWWTGLAPAICPGFNDEGKLISLPIPDLSKCTRDGVRDYFNNSWTLTELLFSSLIGDEPFYRPPYHELRHPLIFYYVHPVVLYINKLRVAGLRDQALDPFFESLFETGVDEMSWDDMSKNVIEWPSIDAAHEYRKKAYAVILDIINNDPNLRDDHPPILQDHPLWALFMGFEHERIHLETSSVLIRELPVHLLSRPKEWADLYPLAESSKITSVEDADTVSDSDRSQNAKVRPEPGIHFPINHMIKVPAQSVNYGKNKDWPCYEWDNEYGKRSARLSEFFASQMLISNGEFWQFVAAGGYHDEKYWTSTGWRWRSFRNVKWPSFWVQDGPSGAHEYRLRTCFEIIPMQWNWPAVVNFHEAQAYCKWKSLNDNKQYRLITESEHHALRSVCKFENKNADNLIVPDCFNTNLKFGSESPVNTGRDDSAQFFDLFGNVWQWCEDHFNPLDGFRVHRFYDDFSSPCFDGQHQIILGGSFASTGDEITPWARFHFRPHFFQHAGFRLVEDPEGGNGCVVRIGEDEHSASPYESQDTFNEYMTLHFGDANLQMPFESGPKAATLFPQRCAELLIDWCKKLSIPQGRALDIGCAVGGASFRLAQDFEHVTGIDLSERFIKAAKELKEKTELEYECKIEASLYSSQKARINPNSAKKVDFRQADACALPPEYLDFDAVLMANLLCRLPSPSACLSRMAGSRGIVKPGGLLVTVSPYTWIDKFTPPDVWLGGFRNDEGEECYSEDGLKKMLSTDFELLETRDFPLVIREHRRKYQYIVSQAMVWRRRS